MSSHHEWEAEVVARHNLQKPFAPENGQSLKFKVGDPVIFTNDYGISFKFHVTGFYRPTGPCSLYACGRRYLVDSDSPWFPVRESQLQLAEEANQATRHDATVDFRNQGNTQGESRSARLIHSTWRSA